MSESAPEIPDAGPSFWRPRPLPPWWYDRVMAMAGPAWPSLGSRGRRESRAPGGKESATVFAMPGMTGYGCFAFGESSAAGEQSAVKKGISSWVTDHRSPFINRRRKSSPKLLTSPRRSSRRRRPSSSGTRTVSPGWLSERLPLLLRNPAAISVAPQPGSAIPAARTSRIRRRE